jgi:hypothetical protein
MLVWTFNLNGSKCEFSSYEIHWVLHSISHVDQSGSVCLYCRPTESTTTGAGAHHGPSRSWISAIFTVGNSMVGLINRSQILKWAQSILIAIFDCPSDMRERDEHTPLTKQTNVFNLGLLTATAGWSCKVPLASSFIREWPTDTHQRQQPFRPRRSGTEEQS